MTTLWKNEIDNIKNLFALGYTLENVGERYDVSKQRMYQVLTKFGIDTPHHHKKNFLRGREPKYYWLNKMLCKIGIPKIERLELLKSLPLPEKCPMLNLELNYSGTGAEGYSRIDNSPSIDRINSDKGYEKENIQVISWRANRIKNNSTPDELIKIGECMML
jgi:hypothetical protein